MIRLKIHTSEKIFRPTSTQKNDNMQITCGPVGSQHLELPSPLHPIFPDWASNGPIRSNYIVIVSSCGQCLIRISFSSWSERISSSWVVGNGGTSALRPGPGHWQPAARSDWSESGTSFFLFEVKHSETYSLDSSERSKHLHNASNVSWRPSARASGSFCCGTSATARSSLLTCSIKSRIRLGITKLNQLSLSKTWGFHQAFTSEEMGFHMENHGEIHQWK